VYDPGTPQPPQVWGWTCSACALDWVLRATGLAPSHTRGLAIVEIGYPQHINPTYGLMDGSGVQLQRVLSEYGQSSEQGYLDFDTTYALAARGPGMCSGAAWYHWVGIRGVSGDAIWIANSAPGYLGVYDLLSRSDFERLGGFSVVHLV
jgi:hypothetical protein